jgi:hypothetical protein
MKFPFLSCYAWPKKVVCVYSASTPVGGLLYVQIVEALEIECFGSNGINPLYLFLASF